MNLQPGEVGHTLNLLRDRDLVYSELGARAERFGHKMAGALELDQQEQALICVLMLRGPQTPGELRTHATRLAEFTDLAQVQDCLELLMAREPHPAQAGAAPRGCPVLKIYVPPMPWRFARCYIFPPGPESA